MVIVVGCDLHCGGRLLAFDLIMNLLNKTFLVSVIMNLASLCEPIVIGAFNIKTFGASKYSEADTMDYIKKVLCIVHSHHIHIHILHE